MGLKSKPPALCPSPFKFLALDLSGGRLALGLVTLLSPSGLVKTEAEPGAVAGKKGRKEPRRTHTGPRGQRLLCGPPSSWSRAVSSAGLPSREPISPSTEAASCFFRSSGLGSATKLAELSVRASEVGARCWVACCVRLGVVIPG